jgi:hypothetical protein
MMPSESNATSALLDSEGPVEIFLHSRVLGDAFHYTHRIYLPKGHGIRKTFVALFAATLLRPVMNDVRKVIEVLKAQGRTWSETVKYNKRWLWKRVRRRTPDKDTLTRDLKALFTKYGPMKDARSGDTIFNKAAWKEVKGILSEAEAGLISDPDDTSFYYIMGTDKHGLTVYHNKRGTNDLEGGVHHDIRRKFGPFAAGPRLGRGLLQNCFKSDCAGSARSDLCEYIAHESR